jgi:rare lipoprotein A
MENTTYFKKSKKLMIMSFLIMLCFNKFVFSQIETTAIIVDTTIIDTSIVSLKEKSDSSKKILYGQASFYSDKFIGKKTANGEIFSQEKYTAACNLLPLGTWIRVTNLKNGKSVIVKTNDRLHPRMKRLVDLSRAAAKKINYINSGITKVKVEVVKKNTLK